MAQDTHRDHLVTIRQTNTAHSGRVAPCEDADITDPEEANDQGTLAFKEKDWRRASERFSRAIDLAQDSNEPKAVNFGNRAKAALKMGNGLQAVEEGGQATQIAPDFAKGYVRYRRACVRQQ